MDALRLRFPDRRLPDLVLSQGVHAIGRDHDGHPAPVEEPAAALAQFCVDRRGVWLQVREGARGLHVNGRPVRRMAMLRAGDAVYVDGVELALVGRAPSAPDDAAGAGEADGESRIVLRGVAGPHHGRCHPLDQPLAIARLGNGELRVDEAGGEVLARFEPHTDGVVVRTREGQVNGWPVEQALLRPGDQLVLDAQHRFVIEAPVVAPAQGPAVDPGGDAHVQQVAEGRSTAAASARRLPWLLLAALLLSAALSLLLLYGGR